MDLGHDTVCALGVTADLVNTGPPGVAEESLTGGGPLRAFIAAHDISDVGLIDATDLDAVRRLRRRLKEIFAAPDQPTSIMLVNALIADARTTPRLTDHDDWPLHLHYHAPDAPLAEHLAADCGMALAFLVAAGEQHRLATCAAPGCERVLVDLSRNRSRRYCDSRTCGNRLHVAAYRARQRTG